MKKLFIVVVSVLFVSACSKAPVLNLYNQPAPQTLTMEQMEACITEGGARLNWRMSKIKPGLIEGTLLIRTHTAVVSIPYDETKYSITYKGSDNLKYDSGKIHKNYNRWIRNLDKEIRLRIIEEGNRK